MIDEQERVIVLSWIQNFFQKLRKEEDEEGKMTDYFLNREPDHPVTISQYDTLKDLDARIAYQYPKGDSPPKRVIRSNQRQLTSRPKPLVELPKKSRLVEKSKSTPEVPKVQSAKKEQQSRPRGPFHPTEIPSPVFGFNRPQKTTSIVEHELSDFFKDEPAELVNEEMVQSKVVEPELSEFVSDEVDEQLNDERVQLKVVEPVFKEDVQAETLELILGAIVQTEASETELKEKVQTETIEFVCEKEEHLLDQPDEDVAEFESHAPPAMRSRLPFNVMMLKQDKQKWEQRKRDRDLEQEELRQQEIIVVQEKPVPEIPDPEKPSVHEEVENNGLYELPKSNLLSPPVTEM
jgi:S-DNA-T family DNA segregation ATPase FtsK/SpoIIIE